MPTIGSWETLQITGRVPGTVLSIRPLAKLSIITSQTLPNVSFQPGYLSSSQSRSAGLTPAAGFHHRVGRHE